MKQNIVKKVILSSSIALMGLGAISTVATELPIHTQANAAEINQNQAEALKKYYLQKPEIFSLKKLRQATEGSDKGKIFVDFNSSWGAEIKVFGGESWGNINNLRGKDVDVFGIKDKPTEKYFWTYTETFTGGVTPAANPKAPLYPVNVIVKRNAETKTDTHIKAFDTRKEQITLKELDFQIRQALIKQGKLYTNNHNTGTVTIMTKDNKKYTLDLSQKLGSDRANVFVQGKNIAAIFADIK